MKRSIIRKSVLVLALMVFLSVCILSVAAATDMAEFDLLVNKNGNVILYNVRTFDGSPERNPLDFSDYQLIIESDQGLLDGAYLPVSFALLDPFREVNEAPVTVKLPYSQDFEILKVYHKDKIIFEDDISYLCRENGICEENENYVSCPNDCVSGSADGLCDRVDDDICDADCLLGGDKDCRPQGSLPNLISLVGGIISLLLLLFVLVKFWRTDNPLEQEKYRKWIHYLIILFGLLVILPQIIGLFI